MKNKSFIKKFKKKFNSNGLELKVEEVKKRDHFIFNIYHKNKYIVYLQVSRGSREFGKTLIGLMSNQLGISNSDLKGIDSCTFWGKDFLKKSSNFIR